ncbi:MAG: hypothetical protein ABWZ25_02785 [Chitinophagaceae bacterium]
MRKIIMLLALTSVFLSARSQSVNDIMQKYITAVGGVSNADKIKTLKMTASIAVQGMEFPLTQEIISDRAVKTNVEVMGTAVVMSYKDGKGWKINQFAGAPAPTLMDSVEIAGQRAQTSVISPLFDSKKNGDKLELVGEETVDGAKAWKIKSTDKYGQVVNYYINEANNDLIRSTMTKNINGTNMEEETTYEDYRNVDGVRLPFTLTNKVGGAVTQLIKVDKYEFNVPVDEKIFDMPSN